MPIAPIPGTNYDYDEELSFRDFTGWEFLSRPEYDFNNKVVYATCFSQENPDSIVFPENLSGTIFLNCNLDNVSIPVGCEVIMFNGGSQKTFQVQNDLRDWELDDKGDPVKVLNEKYWIQKGITVDPEHIPDQKIQLDPQKGETIEDKLKEITDEIGQIEV